MSEKICIPPLLIWMGCLAFPLTQTAGTGASTTDLRAHQPAHISAAIGHSVTLNCSFNYTGSIDDVRMGTFYAKANETNKAENVDCKRLIAKTGLLACEFSYTITNLRPENESTYFCEVWIPRSQGTLRVRGRGTNISLYSEATYIAIQQPPLLVSGKEALLTCSVHGFYPRGLSVLWFRGDRRVSDSNIRNIINRDQDGTFSLRTELRFKATAADNEAEYHCRVSNLTVGWERATSTVLSVKYAPSGVNVATHSGGVINGTLRLEVGSLLNVTCSADGNPSPKARWLSGGTGAWHDGDTLQLAAVQKEHSGVYWCVVTNPYGERNTSLHLLVFQSWGSTGDPGLITLYVLGAILIFSVLASIVCVLRRSERIKVQGLAGFNQHGTFSHEDLTASPATDEIYSVLNISTKRSKKQNPAPQTVDEAQLIYADIMFASRNKSMRTAANSSTTSTVVYGEVNTRSSTRGGKQGESLYRGCPQGKVPEHLQTH